MLEEVFLLMPLFRLEKLSAAKPGSIFMPFDARAMMNYRFVANALSVAWKCSPEDVIVGGQEEIEASERVVDYTVVVRRTIRKPRSDDFVKIGGGALR
jgi:hypothetical protein